MLVTLSAMKSFLGISGSTYDTFLTDQINLISEAVEGYCGRVFTQTTYTQTFYQDECTNDDTYQELLTYQFPIISITSVKEGIPPTEAITEYRVNKDVGKLINTTGWFANGDIEVVYSAGYATIPYVIQNVVFNLVAERYNKKVGGIDLSFGSNVQRVSIPGTIAIDFDYTLSTNERISKFGIFLGDYLNALDPYRTERVLVGDIRNHYVA